MSGIRMRPVMWMTALMRPAAMPSVECPKVRDWETGRTGKRWMALGHCLACAWCVSIDVDCKKRTGSVGCSAQGGE